MCSDMPLNPHYNQAIQATTLNGQIVCTNAVGPRQRLRADQHLRQRCAERGGAGLHRSRSTVRSSTRTRRRTRRASPSTASRSRSGRGRCRSPSAVSSGKEYYRVVADAYGNGVTPDSPNNATIRPILSSARAATTGMPATTTTAPVSIT